MKQQIVTENYTKSNYRIIIADDYEIMRLAIRKMLDRIPNIMVVDEAQSGHDLLKKLVLTPCDIVWLDITMPDMDGLEVLSKIKEKYPSTKIIIYSASIENNNFKKAYTIGVDGILLKDDDFSMIRVAIKAIRDGKKFYSDRINK